MTMSDLPQIHPFHSLPSPLSREAILKDIEGKLTSGVDASNDTFLLMAASVYYHEQVRDCYTTCTTCDVGATFPPQNFDSALRCLNQSDSLEG